MVVGAKDSGGTYRNEYLDIYRRITDVGGRLIIAKLGVVAARYLQEASTTPSARF